MPIQDKGKIVYRRSSPPPPPVADVLRKGRYLYPDFHLLLHRSVRGRDLGRLPLGAQPTPEHSVHLCRCTHLQLCTTQYSLHSTHESHATAGRARPHPGPGHTDTASPVPGYMSKTKPNGKNGLTRYVGNKRKFDSCNSCKRMVHAPTACCM